MTSEHSSRPLSSDPASGQSAKLASERVLSAQDRAAWLSGVDPGRADRQRVRQALWLALASGSVSATASAVDVSMSARAARAVKAARVTSPGLGLKLAASSILVSTALTCMIAWFAHGSGPSPFLQQVLQQETKAGAARNAAQVHPERFDKVAPLAPPRESVAPRIPRHSERFTSRKRLLTSPASETRVAPTRQLESSADDASLASPAKPQIDLAEELRLLRGASEAVAQHDATRALQSLSQYATRFPSGALAKEASALQVMAMCQQADEPAARVVRARFLRAEPSSPLAARVRQACAGLR
jgi:hypothetical protein